MSVDNSDIRKLVTFRRIDDLKPIENADFIEIAVIGGWETIVKKGEFKVGDYGIYFEIDSFLPDGVPAWQFLVDKNTRHVLHEGEMIKGTVLKTIRLRGQYSQGLFLAVDHFPELKNVTIDQQIIDELFYNKLGVFKYEKPLPQSPTIKGTYPSFTRKTDSERVQNLSDRTLAKFAETVEQAGGKWFATEKIDGMSTTYWIDADNILHMASRNHEVSYDEMSVQSVVLENLELNKYLKPGDIIKGEIAGPGICGNPLGLKNLQFFLFDAEVGNDLDKQNYLDTLRVPTYTNITFPSTVAQAVSDVNGLKSLVSPTKLAEGVVWWNTANIEFREIGNRPNFKAINNQYLLKTGD